MLISHRHRFIYTKTIKTAGTSVEAYFEPSCMAEGAWQESHSRAEHVSPEGIVGARGALRVWPFRPRWYHHMPAHRIRTLVGDRVWIEYFKFTVIRNPFSKLVSGYHFFQAGRPTYMARLRAHLGRGEVGVQARREVDDATTISKFRSWVRLGGILPGFGIFDRDKYMIDGRECVDEFIRFEDLPGGIARVCDRLGIPFDPQRIPTYKMGIRHQRIPVRDYYNDETEAIVRRLYAWEFERFGYEMPP